MEPSSSSSSSSSCPPLFRCPISLEIMSDPVTLSTGVTYDRKNIHRWLFVYNKSTCPATRLPLSDSTFTPNHTLKRLILSWLNSQSPSPSSSSITASSSKHDDLVSLLKTLESTPFKVNSLKKLRSLVETGGHPVKSDLVLSGGVDALVRVVLEVLNETSSDYLAFRACEEALGVLLQLPLGEEDGSCTIELILSKPEVMKAMAIMLQRGSAEARLYAVSIFSKLVKSDYDCSFAVRADMGADMVKPLLELVSDGMCAKGSSPCSSASSRALEVLLALMNSSKKSKVKAVEAGAVCTLVELLPESRSRSKTEKILALIKSACECAEGRMALAEHAAGIAAVAEKVVGVSGGATKAGVKILWVVCSMHPTERVAEEMLVVGAVEKVLRVVEEVGTGWSSREKVLKMLKLHGNSWIRFPCCPPQLKEFL